MKVFVLGGYGNVGIPVIQLLATNDRIAQIAVAGRDSERAERAAAELGEVAVAVQVDGTDEEVLASLLADYDIILNAATNEAVLPAVRAAMRAGAHYCDVSFSEVIDSAVELSSEAKVAGITAILANGVHPSITNLMGVHAARKLDEVEQLQLADASLYDFQSGRDLTHLQWLEDPRQSLAVLSDFRGGIEWPLQTALEGGARMVRAYQDGRWVDADPVRSGVDVPLSQGGTINASPYLCGDPFFGALPTDLGTAPPVEMLFTPLPPQLHDLLRELALRVLDGDIEDKAALDSFFATAENDPGRWLTLPDDYVPMAKTWARAVGSKEGRAARYSCWYRAPLWDVGGYYLTSVGLVAAANMILRGDVQERGVFAAEKAFEPQPFFDEVAALLGDQLPEGRLIDESFEWLD